MTVERNGKALGGHNVQIVLRAGVEGGGTLDASSPLALRSGWLVSFRNQFAQAPDVATEIVLSAQHLLDEITQKANAARGKATDELWDALRATDFVAAGPDYWR